MPTMGTLSGSVATAAKLGSRYESPIPRPKQLKRTMPPFLLQRGRQWIAARTRMSIAVTRYCGADRKLMTDLRKWISGMASDRTRDAAVFPHAPEVHRHQKGGHERNADAVEHIETQQGTRADETPAEQSESSVVGRGHQRNVSDLQEACARPLNADERRRGSHVGTDRDRPDGELVPRQQITGEGEKQSQHEQDHADDPIEFTRRL